MSSINHQLYFTIAYNCGLLMNTQPVDTQRESPAPDHMAALVRGACSEFGMSRVTVAVPFAIAEETAESLLALSEVAGIVLANENSVLAGRFPKRVGWIHAKRHRLWRLPKARARHILFLGSRRIFSFGMGLQALGHGTFVLYFETPFGWSRVPTLTVVAHRLVRFVLFKLLTNRLFGRVKTLPGFGRVRKSLQTVISRLFERRFSAAIDNLVRYQGAPLLSGDEFVPGRALLVNSALAWGGTERQLVNTALGLVGKGARDVTILCENSDEVPDHDFFLWKLRQSSVEVSNLRRYVTKHTPSKQVKGLMPLFEKIDRLDPSLKDDIGFYIQEFLERRPEIVHAWQDQTSVKAGLAAALVGVPKIVLGTRNLAPYRFNYHQPYMRAAYRILSQQKNVSFLNNSRAGAADYSMWLDIPVDKFRVLYNGFSPGDFIRAGDGANQDSKERLGLPGGGRVVGSIFRFYEEKDPLLWVRTAARIADARPDVSFLIIGTGNMRSALLAQAARLGIADRLFLPGIERHPALAYSVMDVLLLTSRLEGLPNVLIEAQALGVPVVSTFAGGCREAVLDGETGVIVKSRDPEKLAKRVVDILDDSTWAEKVRQRGPAFIGERFGIERMIEETLDVYNLDCRMSYPRDSALSSVPNGPAAPAKRRWLHG